MQTLTDARWKELWPNKSWHTAIRHMLGNLTLLPDDVNSKLGHKGLMSDTLTAHKQGPVPFISTSELIEADWDIESFVARHKRMVEVVALRLGLPTCRMLDKLPKICTTPVTGFPKLENTNKL